jgi:nucleotide-binding universal stress UspA family protein
MTFRWRKELTMKTPDRILVPVDLGPETDWVIEAAANFAAAFGAKLRLFYAIEEVPHFPAGLELLKQAAGERLGQLHDRLAARGISSEPPISVIGRSSDAILETADEVQAHVIVMGRGGSRGTVQLRSDLGSTTARVMRRSSKPVLTVASNDHARIRRILCPVDGSGPSARGLRNAILLARALDARLTVMTVIAELAPLEGSARRPDMAKIASDYQTTEREQFERFTEDFDFGDVSWDKQVHFGHAADEIVRLATDANYDLIVMGSTGRSGLPRILLGSTAETVARRVACSVLTVKHEDVASARLELGDIKRWLDEGHQLHRLGMYEDAIGRFDQCLLKDPYLVAALEGQAAAHEQLGHTDLAADLRQQAELIRRELWHEPAPVEAAV